MLSQFSKEKLEVIDYIGSELTFAFDLIDINSTILNGEFVAQNNFMYLSQKIEEIINNQKLTHLFVNFDKEFENLYKLVNRDNQKLIFDTQKLLIMYMKILNNLYNEIEKDKYMSIENKIYSSYVTDNKAIFKEINKNLLKLQTLLKNNFLYS